MFGAQTSSLGTALERTTRQIVTGRTGPIGTGNAPVRATQGAADARGEEPSRWATGPEAGQWRL